MTRWQDRQEPYLCVGFTFLFEKYLLGVKYSHALAMADS